MITDRFRGGGILLGIPHLCNISSRTSGSISYMDIMSSLEHGMIAGVDVEVVIVVVGVVVDEVVVVVMVDV